MEGPEMLYKKALLVKLGVNITLSIRLVSLGTVQSWHVLIIYFQTISHKYNISYLDLACYFLQF